MKRINYDRISWKTLLFTHSQFQFLPFFQDCFICSIQLYVTHKKNLFILWICRIFFLCESFYPKNISFQENRDSKIFTFPLKLKNLWRNQLKGLKLNCILVGMRFRIMFSTGKKSKRKRKIPKEPQKFNHTLELF